MATAAIMRELAAITLTGALAGGLAACGSPASTKQPPRPAATATTAATAPSTATHPARPTADPASDMTAWVAAGGADAFNSVGQCLSAMSATPAPGQVSALSSAIARARSRPIPASVDPKGAYGTVLDLYQKAVTAYKKGDVMTAASYVNSAATGMKTLEDEMRAAGLQVSP